MYRILSTWYSLFLGSFHPPICFSIPHNNHSQVINMYILSNIVSLDDYFLLCVYLNFFVSGTTLYRMCTLQPRTNQPNACFYKRRFIGSQPQSFIWVMSLGPLHATVVMLSLGKKDPLAHKARRAHFLSGPSQNRFAGPCPTMLSDHVPPTHAHRRDPTPPTRSQHPALKGPFWGASLQGLVRESL